MTESPPRPLALLRLMQLVSPSLPVGAFNFSQGLEYAVAAGWVTDEPQSLEWIGGLARAVVGTLDIPILLRLHAAWQREEPAAVANWSARLIAARETSELRAEDLHMGRALARLLVAMDATTYGDLAAWQSRLDASFATLFSCVAVRAQVSADEAAWGYLWAWCETQTLAAVRLVPLGQSAGQRLLDQLLRIIPAIVVRARSIGDDDIGCTAVSQVLASAWHETQYTRLFRS
jgi:urease accessory protein